METKYRKYLNINKKTLEEVRKLINNKYFKKKFISKLKLLIELNKKLSKIYNISYSQIKVVPYNITNKKRNSKYILIGDSLSLISFLSKFKQKMDIQKKGKYEGEVTLKRDCFDWAISIINFSNKELVDKIFETKERLIEEEKEDREMDERLGYSIGLNNNPIQIELKGGKI